MSPPDAERGLGSGALVQIVTPLSDTDKAEDTNPLRHDPARCASCVRHPAFLSYNAARRDELEREAWARGRHRIIDMPEVA